MASTMTMTLCKPATFRARPARRAGPVAALSRQPGDELLPKLRTPLDLLALPGRVALGVLNSMDEVVKNIPTDVERLQMLAKDRRPMQEKQKEVLQEMENRVVSYLEKGSAVEEELLAGIGDAIPKPIKKVLPTELKQAFGAAGSNGSNGSKAPLARWTISSMDDSDDSLPPYYRNGLTLDAKSYSAAGDGAAEEAPESPQQIAASQLAAEVAGVQAAMAALRQHLLALQANTDPSSAIIARLNLDEARQALEQALGEVAPAAARESADALLAAAVSEAELLLADVASVEMAVP